MRKSFSGALGRTTQKVVISMMHMIMDCLQSSYYGTAINPDPGYKWSLESTSLNLPIHLDF